MRPGELSRTGGSHWWPVAACHPHSYWWHQQAPSWPLLMLSGCPDWHPPPPTCNGPTGCLLIDHQLLIKHWRRKHCCLIKCPLVGVFYLLLIYSDTFHSQHPHLIWDHQCTSLRQTCQRKMPAPGGTFASSRGPVQCSLLRQEQREKLAIDALT